MLKHHVQCIKYALYSFQHAAFHYCSVWKPLRGPLRDWPLAVCDAGTVCEDDLVVADQVYSKHVIENVQVQHGPRQKWYYLSNQQPDELLLFRQTDSKPGQLRGGGKSSKLTESCVLSPSGCPHSSFDNPLSGDNDLPRESIEARALVYYGECCHELFHD